MDIPNYILDEIKAYCLKHPSQESGGFVIKTDTGFILMDCQNKSPHPEKHFLFDAYDYLKSSRLGEIWGLYHSHVYNSFFSKIDIDTANDQNLKLILFVIRKNKFKFYDPSSSSYNCLSFVKDYYHKKYGIDLEINFDDLPNAEALCKKYHFHTSNSLKRGNIILLQRHSKIHLGVVMNSKQFLHFGRSGIVVQDIPTDVPFTIYEPLPEN